MHFSILRFGCSKCRQVLCFHLSNAQSTERSLQENPASDSPWPRNKFKAKIFGDLSASCASRCSFLVCSCQRLKALTGPERLGLLGTSQHFKLLNGERSFTLPRELTILSPLKTRGLPFRLLEAQNDPTAGEQVLMSKLGAALRKSSLLSTSLARYAVF